MYNREERKKFEEETSQISNNPTLQRYTEWLQDDLTVTNTNLKEKSLMVSSIRANWLKYLFHEKEVLQKIKNKKQQVIKEKQSGNSSRDSILKLKSDNALINNDPTILKLDSLASMTKDNIDYIERAMNILNDLGWNIKNTIEALKLIS